VLKKLASKGGKKQSAQWREKNDIDDEEDHAGIIEYYVVTLQ